jgi:hypothetical protein
VRPGLTLPFNAVHVREACWQIKELAVGACHGVLLVMSFLRPIAA